MGGRGGGLVEGLKVEILGYLTDSNQKIEKEEGEQEGKRTRFTAKV